MMRYRLSKLVPMWFASTYQVESGGDWVTEHATWWQWRNRIWAHSVKTVSAD